MIETPELFRQPVFDFVIYFLCQFKVLKSV